MSTLQQKEKTFFQRYGFLIPSTSVGTIIGTSLSYVAWNRSNTTRSKLSTMAIFGVGIGISIFFGSRFIPSDAYDHFNAKMMFFVSIPFICAMITGFTIFTTTYLGTTVVNKFINRN